MIIKNVKIRIPKTIYNTMMTDLKRPHAHADERVGFCYSTTSYLTGDTAILTFKDYEPVLDDNYIDDDSVGANINSNAIRSAMQTCLDRDWGGFHVHLHNHKGNPNPSKTDKNSLPGVVQSLSNVCRDQATGILILSKDSFYASVKVPGQPDWIVPQCISIIGYPMKLYFPESESLETFDRFDRQSFLGERSTSLFQNIQVGIVGLGGGGSHVVQQLAHLGVKNLCIFDDDIIENSNLNRLVGATKLDVYEGSRKTTIAERLIKGVLPDANITVISSKWQDDPENLQKCDIVIAGVDTFYSRAQLEAECRRYLIPYIDIGMDIHRNGKSFTMSGQIILSMPGMPCMRAMGFLNDEKLAAEAAKYGAVGGMPQVVWPNGILASSAIGVFVDIVTGWNRQEDKMVYLSYDGNTGILSQHIRLKYIESNTCHFDLQETGTVKFQIL